MNFLCLTSISLANPLDQKLAIELGTIRHWISFKTRLTIILARVLRAGRGRPGVPRCADNVRNGTEEIETDDSSRSEGRAGGWSAVAARVYNKNVMGGYYK
ncbi:hypothetical protein EVAR_7258_1 [Eumeta japonica]|uniref:Uncharacterized protein n=1 Tax=Eumeta variegata TaxID=151549 RepID=A0A4C1T399_EUMVA|nr:hypothetical protein EVAR_7258_1 [Eumeta japonica]